MRKREKVVSGVVGRERRALGRGLPEPFGKSCAEASRVRWETCLSFGADSAEWVEWGTRIGRETDADPNYGPRTSRGEAELWVCVRAGGHTLSTDHDV